MNYQLHDYELDSVYFENDAIVFSFPKGFYVTDENGQELKPRRTKLAFILDRSCCPNETLESFIHIRRIKRGRNGWKDLSFKRFTDLFRKGNMIVYDEFDSKLTNRKIFEINAPTRWSNIELMIEDIIDVVCLS